MKGEGYSRVVTVTNASATITKAKEKVSQREGQRTRGTRKKGIM